MPAGNAHGSQASLTQATDMLHSADFSRCRDHAGRWPFSLLANPEEPDSALHGECITATMTRRRFTILVLAAFVMLGCGRTDRDAADEA